MANVTIQNESDVIFTFSDGDVMTVTSDIVTNLDENPTPGTTSNNAYVIDFNGTIRRVTITGSFTDAVTTRTSSGTVTTIEQQVAWLEALKTGFQTGYTFNSTYLTNKTLYVRRFKYDEEQGKPNELPFTLELVEGL